MRATIQSADYLKTAITDESIPDNDRIKFKANMYFMVTASQMHNDLDEVFDGFNITSGRYLSLLLINFFKTATPGQLASSLGLKAATISGILNHIEKDGLIERTAGVIDGRVSEIRITEKGSSLISEIQPRLSETISKHWSSFEDSECSQLISFIEKLNPKQLVKLD